MEESRPEMKNYLSADYAEGVATKKAQKAQNGRVVGWSGWKSAGGGTVRFSLCIFCLFVAAFFFSV
jgi:hypothetical protein